MKTCLVTGASGGIGSQIAKALSKLGYSVILQGRNKAKLQELKTSIGDNCELIIGDLNIHTDRTNVLEQLFKHHDIDLLVNAAGISQFSAFESMSEANIAEIMTTNLITPMLFTQEFIYLEKTRNHEKLVTIVNVGSAFGYIGYPGFSCYAASKFGLRGFTESLRREYTDTRFKFAYFAPRATQTEINSSQVEKMNLALGNSVDTPEFVAQQFILFLKKQATEATVGWPEKLFVRLNSLMPNLVDKAIKSKLPVIKQHMGA